MTRFRKAAALIAFLAPPALLFAQEQAPQGGGTLDVINRKFADLQNEQAQNQAGDLRVAFEDAVFTTDGRITHFVVNRAAGPAQDQEQARAQVRNEQAEADQADSPTMGASPGTGDGGGDQQTAQAQQGPQEPAEGGARYLVPADRFTFGTAVQMNLVQLTAQEFQGLPTMEDETLPASIGQAGGTQQLLASQFRDYKVFNQANQDLGGIDDIMLDLKNMRVAYFAVAAGGFLGIGENLYAVPLSAIARLDTAQQTIVVDITEEQLRASPGFNADNWPVQAPDWTRQQPQQQ